MWGLDGPMPCAPSRSLPALSASPWRRPGTAARGDGRRLDWDVKAAEAAGIPTLAVLTGGFSEEELREAGTAAIVKSVEELRQDRAALIRELPLKAKRA